MVQELPDTVVHFDSIESAVQDIGKRQDKGHLSPNKAALRTLIRFCF